MFTVRNYKTSHRDSPVEYAPAWCAVSLRSIPVSEPQVSFYVN